MNKIIFIDKLRAIATIMVMCWHLGVMFWFSYEDVMVLCQQEPSGGVMHLLPDFFSKIVALVVGLKFDFGMFGVAIFFLITGFIIPFSVKSANNFRMKVKFILKRILRIWPVYAIGFLIVFSVLIANGAEYDLKSYLIQASLMRDWFWVESLDGISWTLEVQLKFYIIIFVLLLLNKLHNPKMISILTVFMMGFSVCFYSICNDLLLINIKLYQWGSVLAMAFLYIIFMFLGFVLYEYDSKTWDRKTCLLVTQILLVCWIICIVVGDSKLLLSKFLINYGGAFILFINFYIFKNDMNETKVLSFVSKYSFSIYILHGVLGYIILDKLCRFGISAIISLPLVISFIIFISVVFYYFVEKRIGIISKKILDGKY